MALTAAAAKPWHRGAGSLSKRAPLAAQGAAGAAAQNDLGMLFQKAAAAVPAPQSAEQGRRRKLQERKPRLPLPGRQAAGGPSGGRGQAAQFGFLFLFAAGRIGLQQGLPVAGGSSGQDGYGHGRDGEVHVTASGGIETTEWNRRRGLRGFGEGNDGVIEGGETAHLNTLRSGVVARSGEDLPFLCARRGRSDEPGKAGFTAFRVNGDGELDRFAHAQNVGRQGGRVHGKMLTAPVKPGNSFARQGRTVNPAV
jgi:hypothetical protein